MATCKVQCKTALQEMTGLAKKRRCNFVCYSRLTEQKGLNLLIEALVEIINRGGHR